MGLYFRSSAIIAVSTVVFSTVLSILGGYAFGTMRFRGSKVLFYTFLLGRIRIASTAIYSIDRSLFQLAAPGATDRRIVRPPGAVTLSVDGGAVPS